MTDLRTNLAPVNPTDLPSPAPDSPVEALEWLGGTADEVAEGLRTRGIKGYRAEADRCPLAEYLHTWWENVSVWRYIDVFSNNTVMSSTTPEPCFTFAKKFDAGEYPDLLA